MHENFSAKLFSKFAENIMKIYEQRLGPLTLQLLIINTMGSHPFLESSNFINPFDVLIKSYRKFVLRIISAINFVHFSLLRCPFCDIFQDKLLN